MLFLIEGKIKGKPFLATSESPSSWQAQIRVVEKVGGDMEDAEFTYTGPLEKAMEEQRDLVVMRIRESRFRKSGADKF